MWAALLSHPPQGLVFSACWDALLLVIVVKIYLSWYIFYSSSDQSGYWFWLENCMTEVCMFLIKWTVMYSQVIHSHFSAGLKTVQGYEYTGYHALILYSYFTSYYDHFHDYYHEYYYYPLLRNYINHMAKSMWICSWYSYSKLHSSRKAFIYWDRFQAPTTKGYKDKGYRRWMNERTKSKSVQEEINFGLLIVLVLQLLIQSTNKARLITTAPPCPLFSSRHF